MNLTELATPAVALGFLLVVFGAVSFCWWASRTAPTRPARPARRKTCVGRHRPGGR